MNQKPRLMSITYNKAQIMTALSAPKTFFPHDIIALLLDSNARITVIDYNTAEMSSPWRVL